MIQTRSPRCALPYATASLLCLSIAVNCLADYRTLVDNGSSDNRVDVVFLGDGYRQQDLTDIYPAHINAMVDHMFDEAPFSRYRNFFNIHAIDVVSNQTGADVPPEGIFRDTALDARYFFDGVTERLLYVSEPRANAARNSALVNAPFRAEMQLISVNDSRYGGGGGRYAVYAGGNVAAPEIALHELGHSFSGLADEYVSFNQPYMGPEPGAVNVTTDPAGGKWSHWIGYDQPDIGRIGVYEGAHYYATGVYRPSEDSKMRSLNRPFDAVSREKIVLDIYDLVDPLDDWRDNNTTLVDPGSLWVESIDANLIEFEWSIDGQPVNGATGAEFDPRDYGFGPGAYDVSVHAYDPTDWVRIDLEALSQTIQWSIELSGLLGDFDQDGILSHSDVDAPTLAVRSGEHDPTYDVNADGLVNQDDRVVWVNELANTYFGDANLDRQFDTTDLTIVFQAAEYEDGIPENSTWETGDWSGDLEFGTEDLVVAFQAGGYEQGPRPVASVPEPSGTSCMFLVLVLLFRRRNWRVENIESGRCRRPH